ncbi:unnamed protein product [Aureobasidium vineae]|uniref:Uncharacterized protein n=1 Tax=Aureobasidium vineae TaxID=2773715 RepID=A0A9N8K2J9_9PEZI|nr:unnamed protein product [Aureobasidium vineae]
MGNCFGKQKSDNFSSSGQTLGTSASQPPKPVANTQNPAISASYSPTPKQGRTIGGSSASPSQSDARTAAALAAETHNSTMNEASREALLARNADANAETRAYN